MGQCKLCQKESEFISSFLGLCKNCILKNPEALKIAKEAHKKSREKFNLTPSIPKKGLQCNGCGNECKIPNGGKGYCGLVQNKNNRIIRLTKNKGLCQWYYDPLPTNCVSVEWCPAGTGCGYPKFAKTKGPEYTYNNLSVFYGACNFNCLFCQNWHFKNLTESLSPLISAEDLASKVNERVTCICYFGGTPDPQLPHAIETSKLALERKKDILRICMETNGNSNPLLLRKFAKIAYDSGGNIKFDLKTFDENLNLALTGISNKTTKKNFKMLVPFHKKRTNIPFLTASTLLIPGYIDEEQVRKISCFISSLDETIPYNLLAFYPHFMFNDLLLTTRRLAENCLKAAKEEGLKRVRIGNVHLLQ